MKLSGKMKTELYNAFSSRIMDLRCELQSDPRLNDKEKLDARLFKLEQQIWRDIKVALNIKD